MGMPVGELAARMSAREVRAWMEYDSAECIGPERIDLAAGIIAAVVANAHRNPKRRAQPFAPRDFMPLVERAQRAADRARIDAAGPMTERENHDLQRVFRGLARAMGGRVVEKKRGIGQQASGSSEERKKMAPD